MQKRAVIYCRVSSAKQAQQGESLEDQASVCIEIARRYNAAVVPNGKIFKEAFSGRKDHRPVFDEVMEYIKTHQGEVDYFIIRNIDRLTRGGSTVYGQLKSQLTKYGVALLDGNGIVQTSQNTLAGTGFSYDWSEQSPSEISEIITAQAGKVEVTTILTRLIKEEIKLTQQGYRVRAPNDGYRNEKIFTTEGKKRTIQIPDPSRAEFFREMFKLRAENNFDDHEICKRINAMGFKTQEKNRWDSGRRKILGKSGGSKLTPKILQSLIKRPAYCGVIIEKWTHYLPVRTPYDGLVSIDLFNQANRGKIYIKEYEDGSLEILHNQSKERVIRHRNKNNALYPFRNIILCPYCSGSFKGSASKGKSGKHYENYHCSRGHKYFGVSKVTFEENIKKFIQSLELDQHFLNILDTKLIKQYRKHQSELLQASASIHRNLADLESRKQQAVDNLFECSSPVVKKTIEQRIESIERDIEQVKKQSKKTEIDESDVTAFLRYAKHFMEHIDEMLIDTGDMRKQQALFGLVFDEFPTYQQILSGTPKLSLVFAIKKNHLDSGSLLVTPRGVEPRLQA